MRRAAYPALLLAAILASPAPAAASTFGERTFTCPVTGKPFKATVQVSGNQFGVDLDMRPYGAIAVPWPLAVCPDPSRFPLFQDSFSPAEVARIREIVAASDYKQVIAEGHQSYYVAGRLQRMLGQAPMQVAQSFLSASWQAAPGSSQQKRYLTEARTQFALAADAPGRPVEAVRIARFLQVELSRQLGEFDKALGMLDAWFPPGSAQDKGFAAFLRDEREALQQRNDAPVQVRPAP